jgi:release factor glutamine methyltransferase
MQNPPNFTDPEWTILKLLNWTTSYFKSHDIDSPRVTAEILLAHTLRLKRIDLYLRYDQPLFRSELSLYKALIKRRIKREPVAYIVGEKEFWSMRLAVTRDVLIPRPETECVIEAVLSVLPDDSKHDSNIGHKRILELGTGSGAIILALASERPDHCYFASDRSIKAIETAKQNARRYGLDGKIHFFSGDWLTPLTHNKHRFDMIVSNPPYIQTRVISRLQPEISRYEPIEALDGDEDGLGCLRRIICDAHTYMNPNGCLILEMDHDQKDAVRKIIEDCRRYDDIAFIKDYSGYHRVVRMRKKRV